jgi:hypothetical protein
VYFQPMNGGVPSFGAHRRFSVSTTDQTDPSVLYCSKPSSATVAFQCSHTSAIELHFSRLSVFFIALGTIVKFPQGQKNLLPTAVLYNTLKATKMCISEEGNIVVRFGKAKAKKNVHLSRPNARRSLPAGVPSGGQGARLLPLQAIQCRCHGRRISRPWEDF